MTKVELINAVAEKSDISRKDSEKVIAAVLSTITETLQKGEKLSIIGFGTFEVKERKERTGINPQTKETIQIAASNSPTFKAGKALKDAMN